MRGRRRRCVARSLALAIVALTTHAQAAPPVRLHVAEDSTCEGSRALATRLARSGIVARESGTSGPEGVDVDVRAMASAEGAQAELVIRRGGRTATRSLTAPTCDEVLDALVFTLSLALEQPIEPTPPPPAPPPPPPPPVVETPPAPPPAPAPARPALAWGAGAGAGVFTGASPSAAPAFVVHGEVESRAPGLVAPSAVLGGTFVVPSSSTLAGSNVAFALQMGTLDGCPVRLGGGRFALRPCLELQAGRLQSRSAGFVGARLESSPWVALALALRGRAHIGAGISLELAIAAGSPLIQDAFSVGDQRVFDVGPFLVSAIAGVGVHFP
jgi:hypothetical protein